MKLKFFFAVLLGTVFVSYSMESVLAGYEKDMIAEFEKYLDRDDAIGAEAAFIIANCYDRLKQWQQAEYFFIISKGRGHAVACNNLGVLYAKQGRIDLAEQNYKMAIKRGCDSHNNLGFLYAKKCNMRLAKSHLMQAIQNGDPVAKKNLEFLTTKYR